MWGNYQNLVFLDFLHENKFERKDSNVMQGNCLGASFKKRLAKNTVVRHSKTREAREHGVNLENQKYKQDRQSRQVTVTPRTTFNKMILPQCSTFGRNFSLRSILISLCKETMGKCLHQYKTSEMSFQNYLHLITHHTFALGKTLSKYNRCRKPFSYHSDLVNFHRTHAGGKIAHIKHNEYEKAFSHSRSLTQQRIHIRKKFFACNEYKKTFTWKADFICQQKTHIEEKPFDCNECGEAFLRRSYFVRHKGDPAAEIPFTYNECGKAFKRWANFFYLSENSYKKETLFMY
ncbi:uncharacterized protein LOC141540383 isoform X2 [Sminthopsis crassicaudata]|uniref:uncharacterized protein LOC141540383 isoform X2 n=1 Tax=Sminthopsis crassicaudata TaxID=9301 RepID=UPI003D694F1D